MNGHALLWPAEASANSAGVDALFLTLVIFSSLMAVAFYIAIIVFAIRYRRGARVDRRNPPDSKRGLEATWTIAPLLVFLGLYVWSARQFAQDYRSEPDALPIYVVAKQWMWTLEHREGRREINELHLPVDVPVRLVMASQDVIHSFYVPAFRIKQDVVPGRYTTISFTPTRTGEYRLFCAEYCGTEHSRMTGRIVVMRADEYAHWLEAGNAQTALAQRGFALFREKGCSGCHAAGAAVHAPDLAGIYGRRVVLADGSRVVADEDYLRDAMLLPDKQVAAGFKPIMPSFTGQLDEGEIAALIEYLKTPDGAPP